MIPNIIVYYVSPATDRQPERKIAKAAFVNAGDALIFWKGLPDTRKRYLTMETKEGEPVIEIAHAGFISWSGGYGHASALTKKKPLPPREGDREKAKKVGWEFEPIQSKEK